MTQKAIPKALGEFLGCFSRGEFWESHEVLEVPWRQNRSGFYKGLILLASALVHVQRGNPRGVVAQCRKAERELAPFRPHYLGLQVEEILSHLRALRQAAEGGEPLPPAPRLAADLRLIRGDEREL